MNPRPEEIQSNFLLENSGGSDAGSTAFYCLPTRKWTWVYRQGEKSIQRKIGAKAGG